MRAGRCDPPVSDLASTVSEEWLWGWDPTPGIVSVHASQDGRALVWRRRPETGELVREEARFRPWLLLDRLDDLAAPRRAGSAAEGRCRPRPGIRHRELDGPRRAAPPRERRRRPRAGRGAPPRRLRAARAAASATSRARTGTPSSRCRPRSSTWSPRGGRTSATSPSTGLHRLQFDLETTGPRRAARPHLHDLGPRPRRRHRGARGGGRGRRRGGRADPPAGGERAAADPDVIENHNLHGFDLPFLDRALAPPRRAALPGAHGRAGPRARAARRGAPSGGPRRPPPRPLRRAGPRADRHARRRAAPRLLHARPAGARPEGGRAPPGRRRAGSRVRPGRSDPRRRTARDPERVRRYATDDVEEVAASRRLLGGAAYALARMVPRRYERLADAGPATGVIDPLLVRAYLRAGEALPAHRAGDGTPHSGAALHLFAAGVARPGGEGGRRQPLPLADAGVPHRAGARPAGRPARAGGRAGRAPAGRQGEGPRRAAGLRGAARARGDVGRDQDRRQLGLRVPGRGRAHPLRRRARRQRGDAARARGACAAVPGARRRAA